MLLALLQKCAELMQNAREDKSASPRVKHKEEDGV
jgi:hypothetical protein